MAFSDQLKKLMDKKNMKAVDLARATGLSEAAISDYLKGKKEPRGRQSIAIAAALDVSLDTLWETKFNSDAIESAYEDEFLIDQIAKKHKLSEQDEEMLRNFFKLSPEQRYAINHYVKITMLSSQLEEKE